MKLMKPVLPDSPCVLLGVRKKRQKIGSLKVVNICKAVMEGFEMIGFADILVME